MGAEYVSPDAMAEAAIPLWVLICGRLAPLSSILMYLSPIPTIRQVLRQGTVGDLPLLPYTSMVASCFVWILYGALKREIMIWGTNIVEFTLSLYYFVEFTNYAPKSSPTFPGSVYQHIKLCFGIWGLSIFLAIFSSERIDRIGDIQVCLTVATFASPLAALRACVESQSSESIPWPYTLAALFNCILWSIVGLFELHDHYVSAPALLGLVFCLAQIAVKLYYHEHEEGFLRISQQQSAAPVEMPYPVLGQVRQVIMLGNDLADAHNQYANPLAGHHDLHMHMNFDVGSGSSGSNTDYVEMGMPLKAEEGQVEHSNNNVFYRPSQQTSQPAAATTTALQGFSPASFLDPPSGTSSAAAHESIYFEASPTSNEPSEASLFATPPPRDSFRSRSSSNSGQPGHGLMNQQQQPTEHLGQHGHGL